MRRRRRWREYDFEILEHSGDQKAAIQHDVFRFVYLMQFPSSRRRFPIPFHFDNGLDHFRLFIYVLYGTT